jgi:tetratricopeptide (TPR) repeat protein/4-amino-4-deoxy-L-arabinose transferase-like glycosyltransferase
VTFRIGTLAVEHRWLIALCLVFLGLGIFRLNDLSLYTDSTRYVIWGNSFAHLKGLVDDTQPEPERYIVNAPLYAVLLSPALVLFPLSLTAAKVWTLFWAIGFLIAFYLYLARAAGKALAIIGVIPLAFNPLFLLISTEVLSEAAFLMLAFLSFLLLDRLEDPGSKRRGDFLSLIMILSLIVLLREVAIALVGAIVLYFVFRGEYKRAGIVVLGAVVCYSAWLFRNLVLVGTPPASQSTNLSFMFHHFVTSPSAPLIQEIALRMANNARGYALHAAGMLFYPLPEVLIVEPSSLFRAYYKVLIVAKYIIPVLFIPLLLLGVWRDLKEHTTGLVRILFLLAYSCIILAYPIHDVRFLLPLLAFFIFYAILALHWIRTRWFPSARVLPRVAATTLSLLVAAPNLICVGEILHTNIRYTSDPLKFYEHLRSVGLSKNMFTKPWNLMGSWIEQHTPSDIVIASALKEMSIFIGDRKLMELNNGVPVATFDHYVRDFAVEYLLSTSSWDDFRSYEFQMAESRRFWFEPVERIAGMQLFRVHTTYTSPKEEWLSTKRMAFDTVTANGLLRKSRGEILQQRYDDAIASLRKAQELAPTQAMIAYQLTVAYAASGRLQDASTQLQKLFSFAQSSTYTPIATQHIAVAQMQAQAAAMNPLQRSLVLYDVATFYWNFGYYHEAYAILRQTLKANPTFFRGLLWGWYYAIQLGDTLQASTYLHLLENIDPANPVVQQFRTIASLTDSLRRISDPVKRGEIRLAMARSYEAVDLPEEAIDEAQRSIRENPRSAEPWMFQGKLFEKRKAERAARVAYAQALRLDPTNAVARTKVTQ